jgi:hypothetical protein
LFVAVQSVRINNRRWHLLNFAALIQRIIYPRTGTPEVAWNTAANSGFASAIMAASHMLWVGRLLSASDLVGPGLLQLGFGFAYILLAGLAFRRSRVASIAILALIVFEILVEIVFALGLRFNLVILAVAFVLALGGMRGANAVFTQHRKSRS